jgi:hypothetical protein
MREPRTIVLSSMLLLAAGCGGGAGPVDLGSASCANGSAPIALLWRSTSNVSAPPLPSDYYGVPADTTTGMQVSIRAGENFPADHTLVTLFPNVIRELNQLDGFGTAAPALVPFTGPVDLAASGGTKLATASPEKRPRFVFAPGTVGSEPSIFYLNVDPASGHDGERRGAIVDRLANDYLIAEPLTPLDPATHWALVVTRDALGADEGSGPRCVVASDDFRRVLSGGISTPADEATARYAHDAFAAIEAADRSLTPDRVAVPLTFTTQSIVDELLEARATIESEPEPDILPDSVAIETLTDGPVAIRIRGQFSSPDFRGDERLWQHDPTTGELIEKRKLPLDFLLQIPRESDAHHQPFPYAIYLHGLAGDLEEGTTAGDRLARAGIATLGISAVGHRSGSSVLSVFAFFNLLDIALGNENAFGVIRDNFRQSAIDQIETLRLAHHLTTSGYDVAPPLGVPDLDGSKPPVALGVSLGGLMGTTLTAVDPTIGADVLFVGGGVVTKLIQDSPTFKYLIPLFQRILAPGQELPPDSIPSFFALMQTILDRGDPVNFAPYVFGAPLTDRLPDATPRSTLLLQSVPDMIVPNSSNEALARAFGMPLLTPDIAAVTGLTTQATAVRSNEAPGVTVGFFQYAHYHEEKDGPLVKSDHTTIGGAYEPFLQAGTFARTWLDSIGTTDGPVLIDPFDADQVARFSGDLP